MLGEHCAANANRNSSMEELTIDELLAQALPGGPETLRESQAGADALAVAFHCLMVRDGWTALDRSGRPLRGYALPADWNAVAHLWAWDYTRPGAAQNFRLQCGMQPQTRRLFVHASEVAPGGEPMPDNIQVMGIQVGNYVKLQQADSTADGSGWQGVILSQGTLIQMWEECVSAPLWRRALKADQSVHSRGGSSWLTGSWAAQPGGLSATLSQQRHLVLPAAAALVAIGALMLMRQRAAPA